MMNFNNISIRGRFAFGMKCLEACLESNGIKEDSLNEIISKSWEFTTSVRMDIWLEEMVPLVPNHVLEYTQEDPMEEFTHIGKTKTLILREMYLKIPKFINQIFMNSFYIGREHIYSKVKNNSPETIEYLNEIIELMESNEVPLPSKNKYLELEINKERGWGEPVERSYFT